MNVSSGHWYAVLSSNELKNKLVGKTRFEQRFVFWRDADGQAVCLDERCPHRGAALSQGRLRDGTLSCPYHGFRYDRHGRCVEMPMEDNWQIPDHFRARTWQIREEYGYVWMWRGPAMADIELPPLPTLPIPKGMVYGETIQIWPTHYTRCIEGVIDPTHLPFVHPKSIGPFFGPFSRISVDRIDGGFRTNLTKHDRIQHYLDFVYPNIWSQREVTSLLFSVAFAPIDESRTQVYCRWYHRMKSPLFRPFINLWGRIFLFIIFHEDMAILRTQRPANIDNASVDDATTDKLVPSDAALFQYRKLRALHQKELVEYAKPDDLSEVS